MTADDRRVAGYCPHGCGRTLYLGDGGEVTCSYRLCPDRGAVTEILADRETGHIVWFAEATFKIHHPLCERIGDELLKCALDMHIRSLGGPPVAPGKYRAVAQTGAGWAWDVLALGEQPGPCTCPDDCEREH